MIAEYPLNNSVTYDLLESNFDSTIIEIKFTGNKISSRNEIKRYIREEIEPRYINMGMSVQLTWYGPLRLGDGGSTFSKLIITVNH